MEDLYMWKDMLMVLFNLIFYNHSGFISRNEFSDIVKLILHDENGTGDINEDYIEELSSAMDFDKNGKIDVNEFLGKISEMGSVSVFFEPNRIEPQNFQTEPNRSSF